MAAEAAGRRVPRTWCFFSPPLPGERRAGGGLQSWRSRLPEKHRWGGVEKRIFPGFISCVVSVLFLQERFFRRLSVARREGGAVPEQPAAPGHPWALGAVRRKVRVRGRAPALHAASAAALFTSGWELLAVRNPQPRRLHTSKTGSKGLGLGPGGCWGWGCKSTDAEGTSHSPGQARRTRCCHLLPTSGRRLRGKPALSQDQAGRCSVRSCVKAPAPPDPGFPSSCRSQILKSLYSFCLAGGLVLFFFFHKIHKDFTSHTRGTHSPSVHFPDNRLTSVKPLKTMRKNEK